MLIQRYEVELTLIKSWANVVWLYNPFSEQKQVKELKLSFDWYHSRTKQGILWNEIV